MFRAHARYVYSHIRHVHAKKPAKILQIFHIAKYFDKKM